MGADHFDVLIIGAGLSGIDAAYHLQKYCSNKTYVILEQRERIGGTWDLFRYPGIRSDSDMLTMGYSFRPWTSPKAIAPGDDIRDYVTATARDEGIDQHIRFRHTVQSAAWSSPKCELDGECNLPARGRPRRASHSDLQLFVFLCGLLSLQRRRTCRFPDIGRFAGRIIHPQAWPEDLDYAGKRIVIIGSGATAVTLLPAMAETAGHITMLQRSPTYIVSLPAEDAIANFLRRIMPDAWAYKIARWKNVAYLLYVYQMAQRFPNFVKTGITQQIRKQLGPDYDVSHSLHAPVQPLDAAPLPRAERRLLQSRSSTGAPASSPVKSNDSPKAASACNQEKICRPTS